MLIMLIMLAMLGGCIFLIGHGLKKDNCDRVFGGVVFGFLISFLGLIMPLIVSYGSYLDMKSFYTATIEQYRESIEMYESKAVINLNKHSFTDFRYQGYQEQIARFIRDLREECTDYNEKYVKKKTMSGNILFSWYIIGPDEEMRIIRLRTGGKNN